MFYPAITENIGCVAAAVSSLACLGVRSMFAKSREVRAALARNGSRRMYPRPPKKFDAVIEPGNGIGSLKVRGMNIHQYGALVVSKRPVALNSVVHFAIPSMYLMGHAHVRHCDRVSGKYRIGVEFRAELIRSNPGSWQVTRVVQKEGWDGR